jgi:class 3 adenylate cyclase
VLILDVAEYVRLMEEDQHDMEQRWRRIVGHVRNDVLPVHGGRLVETRGDSLVLTFHQVQPAAQAAFAINQLCGDVNEGMPPHRHILLRTGIHVGEVFTQDNDVSGHTVNLAARLMTSVAGPGEIVVSADAHDQLTPMLDADIEDLGDCYLKHVKEPVRAYRIGPPKCRRCAQRLRLFRLPEEPTIRHMMYWARC